MATVAFGGRLGVPNQVGTFDHLEALNDGSGPPIPALDDIGNNADSCRSERRAVLSWEELRGRLEALTDEEDHVTLGLKFEETLSITIPRENLRGNLPKPGRMVSILRTDTEWVVRES